MALGSIEYLQHYFTKTGIAAESECVFSLRLLYMDGDPGRRLWRSQQAAFVGKCRVSPHSPPRTVASCISVVWMWIVMLNIWYVLQSIEQA